MPIYKYQQTFPQSCGAATLMCAALELGINELPANNINFLWAGPRRLKKGPTKEAEIQIYSVTSGENKIPTMVSGYSLPSKLALAADILDLEMTVHLPPSVTSTILTTLYPSEIVDARNAGVNIVRSIPPRLILDQVRLRILRVGGAGFFNIASGLHYVLERRNGSVMDPALGQNYANLDELQRLLRTMAKTAYVDTGITVTLEEKAHNWSIFGNDF